MGFERWTKNRRGRGALIREPDGSVRLELWAIDSDRTETLLEVPSTMGEEQELRKHAELFYIEETGHFDLEQFEYDDATKERLRALGTEIERLDARLTYNGPHDTPFDGWRA